MSRSHCGTQLLGFCDSLALSLNQNIRTDGIYFDFAKAFDSVNHDIILQKLKNKFRIDGYLIAFILNYLKNRCQSVVLGCTRSSIKPVTCIMFCVFISVTELNKVNYLHFFQFWRALYYIRFLKALIDLTKLSQNSKE